MLHADPELVHLREVLQQELDGVRCGAARRRVVPAARVRQQAPHRLTQVRPQEQATDGVLHLSPGKQET